MSDLAFPRCIITIDGDPGSEYPLPGTEYERLVEAMDRGTGVVEAETMEGAPLAFPARRPASVIFLTAETYERILADRLRD